MTKSLSTNASNAQATTGPLQVSLKVEIDWQGTVGLKRYSSDDSWERRILKFSKLSSKVKARGVSMVTSITLTMDDSDGEMKTAFDYGNPKLATCKVYQHFPNQAAADNMLLFEGRVIDPIVWREGKRNVQITLQSEIISNQLGFATQEDQFGVNVDVSIGKTWPIVFGAVKHVPCLRVQTEPNTTLKYPINHDLAADQLFKIATDQDVGFKSIELRDDMKIESFISIDEAGTLSTEANKIYVEDGSGFVQDTVLKISINGVVFQGKMNNDIFTVEEVNAPKYTDIVLGIRPVSDPDYDNPSVFFLPNTTFNLEGTYLFLRQPNPNISFGLDPQIEDLPDGQTLVRKVVRQEGVKVWTERPMDGNPVGSPDWPAHAIIGPETTINEVRGLPLNGIIINLEETFTRIRDILGVRRRRRTAVQEAIGLVPFKVENYYGSLVAQLKAIKFARNIFFNAPAGTVVREWGELEDIYVANAVESSAVRSVYGIRKVDGEELFVPIPTSYYTIDLSEATNAAAQAVGAPPIVTTIKFEQPLSTFKDQGWSDEVYATVASTLSDNTSTQINWILSQYTNLTVDASFGTVATEIANYPSNFVISKQWDAIKLAEDIAWQARLALVIDNDLVGLRNLSSEPSFSFTVDEREAQFQSIEIGLTNSNDLITELVGTWRESYGPEDETVDYFYRNNISTYGYVSQKRDMFIYTSQSLVAKSIDFWGNRYSNIWKTLQVDCFQEVLNVEVFDAVRSTLAVVGNHKCIVTGVSNRVDRTDLGLELLLPVKVGTMTEDSNFWVSQSDASPTNPATGMQQLEYDVRQPQTLDGVINALELLDDLRAKVVRPARIKRLNVDGDTDSVMVDYHDDGIDEPATASDIPAQLTDPEHDPVVGEVVKLSIDKQGKHTIERSEYATLRLEVLNVFADKLIECKLPSDSTSGDPHMSSLRFIVAMFPFERTPTAQENLIMVAQYPVGSFIYAMRVRDYWSGNRLVEWISVFNPQIDWTLIAGYDGAKDQFLKNNLSVISWIDAGDCDE